MMEILVVKIAGKNGERSSPYSNVTIPGQVWLMNGKVITTSVTGIVGFENDVYAKVPSIKSHLRLRF